MSSRLRFDLAGHKSECIFIFIINPSSYDCTIVLALNRRSFPDNADAV